MWPPSHLSLPWALVEKKERTERGSDLDLDSEYVLERHIGFWNYIYYICLLSFSSDVWGFVTCEQSWLSVPKNSVLFLLSEAP